MQGWCTFTCCWLASPNPAKCLATDSNKYRRRRPLIAGASFSIMPHSMRGHVAVSLLILTYWFHEDACLLPALESATQRIYLGKGALFQLPRHTGAGSFTASGAVSHGRPITR